MKILVPVKRVVDYNIKIRLRSDGSGVELANVKMSMNPFDEIAVEEALRQKEAGKATEVVIVSIGPQQAGETIRTALAMGADRGILIKTDASVEPLAVAKLLKGVVDAEQVAADLAGTVGRIRRGQHVQIPGPACFGPLGLGADKAQITPGGGDCGGEHAGDGIDPPIQ